MRISIIHPSRGRPEQAIKTFRKWYYLAEDRYHGLEYILSVDYDDPCQQEYYNLLSQNKEAVTLLILQNESAIDAINNAAKRCTGDIIIIVSDDFDCIGDWDNLLRKELEGKSDFVLKTKDGIQKTLVTLPIMDRVYYERYGYVYHPDYKHLFCDQELTAVAEMTGKLIYSDLVFLHNHYTTGKTQMDAINEKNDLTWNQGQALFNERLKSNFEIINPVKQYDQIQWH
jgi:hypothetical protein